MRVGFRVIQYFTRKQLTTVLTGRRSQRESFEREALPWLDDVARFALSLTHDEPEAEDVVQDTFLRAHRSWHTYIPGSDCRRWLFTICRNVFIRSRQRSRHLVPLDWNDGVAKMSLVAGPHPEERFAFVDVGPAIGRALLEIPEPFRSAVQLVDLEDRSYESAAELLGVPVGTVRSRLFRGRRLMQGRLAPFASDAGFSTTEARARSA